MNGRGSRSLVKVLAMAVLLSALLASPLRAGTPSWMANSIQKLEKELVSKYGEQQRARLKRGMEQVARFWRDQDGDAAGFEEFVRRNFAGDPGTLDRLFRRFERVLEKLDGHMNEIVLAFRRQSDLDGLNP